MSQDSLLTEHLSVITTSSTSRLVTSGRDGSSRTGDNGSRPAKTISQYGAAFMITNAAIGAGLLNFPFAFMESGGLVPGNLIHLFFVCATLGSLYIMAECADRHGARTYQEMVERQCGKVAGHFTSLLIALYCLVTCVTFLIIVGDQTDRLFADWFGPRFCFQWYLSRQFTMAVAGAVVLWLSYYKDMARLEYCGYVGSLLMLYLTIVVVVVWRVGGYTPGVVNVWDSSSPLRTFNVLPTIAFGYQCHVSSVPIYHSIKDRSAAKYFRACCIAVLCCAGVYTLAANFGYLTFGSYVSDDLLLSYDGEHAGSIPIAIAVCGLALKSVTTYPLLMFCTREAVVGAYVLVARMTPEEAQATERSRRLMTVSVLWVLSLLPALLLPNITVVVSLLGSIAAFFIFLFPGLCLLHHTLRAEELSPPAPHHPYPLFIACFYILAGVFTFGVSFGLAVVNIIQPEAGMAPLCVAANVTVAL